MPSAGTKPSETSIIAGRKYDKTDHPQKAIGVDPIVLYCRGDKDKTKKRTDAGKTSKGLN